LPTTIFLPDFLRLDRAELTPLLRCGDPLTIALYLFLRSQCDFNSGELVTNYPRLIELLTPPQPERGRRPSGPTLKQVRRAMDWLDGFKLTRRKLDRNEAQGTLRITVVGMKRRAAPKALEGRV
jgi:hypothetical protein